MREPHGRHHGHFYGHHHGPRGGLQKQIFVGFGIAIGAAVLTAGLVTWVLGGHTHWRREVALAQRFVGSQFARVWDDPAARGALARSIGSDLDVGVRITDTRGAVLERYAWPERCGRELAVEVPERGRVEACLDGQGHAFRPWVTVISFLIPAMVLWGLAGFWARRMARPLRELTAVARDLGEGKLERRARLRHGHRGEVGELTHAVNEMAARIEKQLKDQRELLATVSHELRTPLARVRVLTEIGRDAAATGAAPGRDVFSGIEEEVVEMDHLVGDLLAGARLDFGAVAPRALDAMEVAARALDRASLPSARIEGTAATVHADATLLARVLAALLDNARKHGAGEIILRVVASPEGVTFEVDDSGPGFPPADLPRVFDPFWKKDRGDTRGLGLGLAIVQRIAQAHHGRAYAKNLATGGARVGIFFPGP